MNLNFILKNMRFKRKILNGSQKMRFTEQHQTMSFIHERKKKSNRNLKVLLRRRRKKRRKQFKSLLIHSRFKHQMISLKDLIYSTTYEMMSSGKSILTMELRRLSKKKIFHSQDLYKTIVLMRFKSTFQDQTSLSLKNFTLE